MSEAVAAAPADPNLVIDPKRDRLVIVASTLGTIFEWYDFFIYGTLARGDQHPVFPDRQSDRGPAARPRHFRRGLRGPAARCDPVRYPR